MYPVNPGNQVPTLLSSSGLASVLTHCPAGKALCSGSPPAHLGPSTYPALARPLSIGIFFPLPPLHIATAYVLPNLSTSTTVPSGDSCCHASRLRTDFLALSSQPLSTQVYYHHIRMDTVIWAASPPQGNQPQRSYLPGHSGCLPIADTCCWDPSMCKYQLERVPTPVMPACSEML